MPPHASPAAEVSGGMLMALDTTVDDFGQGATDGKEEPGPPFDFTFACYRDNDTHLGDIKIPDCSPWAEMCDKLKQVAGREATFTFPDPADPDRRVIVSTAAEWAHCLDLFGEREYFLGPRDAAQPVPAERDQLPGKAALER